MKPLLLALVVAPLALGSDTPKAPSLGEPDYLSPMARQIVKKKMRRHGDDMTQLFLSVTLLQRDKAKILATDIANEPRLSRPIVGGEDDLNAALPERFFVLQDELRSKAKALAEATGKVDDAALAESFGRITQTCVECHSIYMKNDRK